MNEIGNMQMYEMDNGRLRMPEEVPPDVNIDPFIENERRTEHATTDRETITHLLKSFLTVGLLSMPFNFKHSGMFLGVFGTLISGLICGHCGYVLVQSGHKLYHRTRRTKMPYAEVAELAFKNGPEWSRRLAPGVKSFIRFSLFVTSFGTCSVYAIVIARNFEKIIENYTLTDIPSLFFFTCLFLPLLLISWVPNFKNLAPVSTAANICMGLGLAITFYYLVDDLPTLDSRDLAKFSSLPKFFAISFFAMQDVGIIMPLENSMATPDHLLGIWGLFSQSMTAVTLIFMFLGFFGYWQYGATTNELIIYNLPIEEWPVQVVQVLIAFSIMCSFGLQFNIALEIAWDGVKRFTKNESRLANYMLRTILVASIVYLGFTMPFIEVYMILIGAIFDSIIALIIPMVIQLLIFTDTGYGRYNWILWKNIAIIIFGLVVVVCGVKYALVKIIRAYTHKAD